MFDGVKEVAHVSLDGRQNKILRGLKTGTYYHFSRIKIFNFSNDKNLNPFIYITTFISTKVSCLPSANQTICVLLYVILSPYKNEQCMIGVFFAEPV